MYVENHSKIPMFLRAMNLSKDTFLNIQIKNFDMNIKKFNTKGIIRDFLLLHSVLINLNIEKKFNF